MILPELEDLKVSSLEVPTFTNLRYGDDTVLVTDSQDDLQMLLDRVVNESSWKSGLTINCKKTECLVVSKKESPKCSLKIGDVIIKQRKHNNRKGQM